MADSRCRGDPYWPRFNARSDHPLEAITFIDRSGVTKPARELDNPTTV
jgi:hypothetical protein